MQPISGYDRVTLDFYEVTLRFDGDPRAHRFTKAKRDCSNINRFMKLFKKWADEYGRPYKVLRIERQKVVRHVILYVNNIEILDERMR